MSPMAITYSAMNSLSGGEIRARLVQRGVAEERADELVRLRDYFDTAKTIIDILNGEG